MSIKSGLKGTIHRHIIKIHVLVISTNDKISGATCQSIMKTVYSNKNQEPIQQFPERCLYKILKFSNLPGFSIQDHSNQILLL